MAENSERHSMTCDMRHALNTMFCLLSVSFLIGELFCSHTHDRYANSMLYIEGITFPKQMLAARAPQAKMITVRTNT